VLAASWGNTGAVCPSIVVPGKPNMGAKWVLISPGKFSAGFDTALSLATCASVRFRSSAARFASSWSSRRAPISVDATPGPDPGQGDGGGGCAHLVGHRAERVDDHMILLARHAPVALGVH
jgi:hypothetical protein